MEELYVTPLPRKHQVHIQSHVVTVGGGRGAIRDLGQVTNLCIFLMEKH